MTTLTIDYNDIALDGSALALLHDAPIPGPVQAGDLVRVTDLEEVSGFARVLEVDGDLVWLAPDLENLEFAGV
jgi:hypothetical protein